MQAFVDNTQIHMMLATAGGIVLFLGLVGGYIRNVFWISEPLVATLVGIAIGPYAFGWAAPLTGDSQSLIIHEIARLTLALAVMNAAIRLPIRYVKSKWKSLGVTVGAGMVVMWIAAAALAALCLGLPLLPALLVGAVVSPTDPVLASVITSGSVAERHIPARIRHLLTAESGLNDGLAMAVVMLPILLLAHSETAWGRWAFDIVLWEIVGAVVAGAAIGWVAMHLLIWTRRQAYSEPHSALTISLALAVTVLAVVRLFDSDGILAVFVAGMFLNRAIDDTEREHEHIQEAIGRFFDLPIFVVFGIVLPWADWFAAGWPILVFVVAVLVLRRLPAWFALCRFVPEVRSLREIVFTGWFGPMGISTLFYATLAVQDTGLDMVWSVASLVVFASILMHGLTAMPLVRRMQRDDDDPEPMSYNPSIPVEFMRPPEP